MYVYIHVCTYVCVRVSGKKENYSRVYPRILGYRSIQRKTTSIRKIINYSNKDTKGKCTRAEDKEIKRDKLPCLPHGK